LAKGLSLAKIADLLKEDVTGADLYSICSNAWLSAVRRIVTSKKDGDEEVTPEKIIVNMDDFQVSLKKFIPSINKADMEYFNQLRSNFT
jgi:peroxin-6